MRSPISKMFRFGRTLTLLFGMCIATTASAAEVECVAEVWDEGRYVCHLIESETYQVSYVECYLSPSLGYGAVREGSLQGEFYSESEISPTISCLGGRG